MIIVYTLLIEFKIYNFGKKCRVCNYVLKAVYAFIFNIFCIKSYLNFS